MSRMDLVKYFMGIARNYNLSLAHEVIQGGISIIKHPMDYSLETLEYWYGICKKVGM